MIGLSVVVGIAVSLTGCETYKPYNSSETPPRLTRAAIMVPPNSKEKMRRAGDIMSVLQKRGIEAIIVPPGDEPPKDVDGYFTYTDNWQWDLTMYLAELEIELHNAQTGRLIASARYKQGFVHRYPDPIEIVDNLVGQILGEPPKVSKPAEKPQNHDMLKN